MDSRRALIAAGIAAVLIFLACQIGDPVIAAIATGLIVFDLVKAGGRF